jgi:tripartite motif-containing protein 56
MNSNSFGTCPEHREAFRYFDTVCQRPICMDCFALNHHGPACQSLAAAATARRSQLQSLVERSQTHFSSLEAAAAAVAKMREEAEAEYAREKAAIGAAFSEVCMVKAPLSQEYVFRVSLAAGAEGGGGAAAGAGV